jgi:hypothetical protein
MKKAFTIKRKVFQFSDEDVKEAASGLNSSAVDRVKFYAKVQDKPYPARQLVVEMIRRKGDTMPDIITYQAIRILRALGFEIKEL